MKLMRYSRFLAISILVVLAAAGSASAAQPDSLYTVQTGTFVPLDPARKQFDTLAASLAKPLRGLLRIEKGAKFHVVRFGLFNNPVEAWKAAREVGAIAPDAYVLREPAGTVERLALISPGITGTEKIYAVEAGCFTSKDAAMKALNGLRLETGGGQASATLADNAGDSVMRIDWLAGINAAWSAIRHLSAVSACVSISGSEALPPPAESAAITVAKPEQAVAAAKTEPEPKGKAANVHRPEIDNEDKVSPQAQSPDANSAGSATGESIGSAAADAAEDMETTFGKINDTMSAMLDQHEYGKAVQVIREYMKRFPDNPDLYAWYGAALSAMDRPDKALEQYRKAAELAPSVPEFHVNVGQSLTKIHMNSVKDAIDSFNAALRLNPNDVAALEGLGSVYVSIGYGDMAEELVLPRMQELDSEAAKRLDLLIKGGVDWSR